MEELKQLAYLVPVLVLSVACAASPEKYEDDQDSASADDTELPSDMDSNSDLDADTGVDTDVDADTDTDVDADTDTDADGDTETQVQSDTDSQGDDTETATESETDTGSGVDTGSETDSDTPEDTDSETDTGGGVDTGISADQFGHWQCKGKKCEAVFEAKKCGDGVCDPETGESDESCPKDCDLGGVPTVSCKAPIDCVFLDWKSAKPGYWVCDKDKDSGISGDVCIAVLDDKWCDDKSCAVLYGETDQSCPADCAGDVEQCGNHIDCIFLPWPDNT